MFCLMNRFISRPFTSLAAVSNRTMCVERVGSPNVILGGIVKYGTILAGSYVIIHLIKIALYQDTPHQVQIRIIKLLNRDMIAVKYLGDNIQKQKITSEKIFQYPDNGALKLDMTFSVRGSKDEGDVHVRARQNEKPKYHKFNWMYEELSLKLSNGKEISVEIK